MPHPARITATVEDIGALARGPVAVRHLGQAGISTARIRSAAGAGALMVMRRGIVVPTDAWTAADEATQRRWALRAALLAYPKAWASHDSAAFSHRLPDFRLEVAVPGDVPPTHVTLVGAARRDAWLRIHGCDTSAAVTEMVDGIRRTNLERTSIEVSATRSLRTAVVHIDAAMRIAAEQESGGRQIRALVLDEGLRTMLRIRWRQALGPYARHRWVTKVREAVELADPAAESVLESLSRVAVIESDLPPPRCGVPIVGDNGQIYWVDMVWDEQRVIGEADGAMKYADPEAIVREKRRQEALEGAGWRVVRWGWSEVMPDAGVMLRRLRRALTAPTRPESL